MNAIQLLTRFGMAKAAGGGGGGGGPDGTQYYVEVTIPTTSVASTLTDFPVYVSLASMPAAFWTHAQSDGGDIRVTESDGSTRCPVDLVDFDNVGETGELHFLASSLSSATNTTYRIYYGGTGLSQPAVGATYGRNAVWGDYAAVYHMNEDPSGSAPQMTDSTGNGNDGTSNGSMTSGDSVAGQLAGNAIDLDGSNDYISAADSATLDLTTAYTISAWFSSAKTALNAMISKGDTPGTDEEYSLYVVTANPDMGGRHNNTNYQAAIAATPSGFEHYVRTWDGTTIRDYFRGALDNTHAPGSSPGASTGELRIGRRFLAFQPYGSGVIDEVRLRASQLSTDWIAAEYLNQDTPGTFYSVGAEQTA